MNQLKRWHEGLLTWIGISSTNNTIGSELLGELKSALEQYRESADSRVMVIYGSGSRFFSPGLDLHEVSRLDRGEMADFMKAFLRLHLTLFTFPKPVIAMLNGDALAGGFFLASCCHFRFGRSGIRVGLTRLSRALAMPYGSLKIVEFLIGAQATREITGGGCSFPAQRAFQIGWLDGIFERGLRDSVRNRALELAAETDGPFLRAKRMERRRLADQIHRAEERHLKEFLEHWFSQRAQREIKEIVQTLTEGTADAV